jgi:DNA-binding MarR family transcriptional regulator
VQRLQKSSYRTSSAAGCASEILDSVPVVLQFIRMQMRRHGRSDLSVPQFRALVFVDRSPGASLSMLAEFLGLSLPATSRLVDGLVGKNFVTRRIPEGNRRLVALALSANGRRTVRVAWQAAEDQLAHIMASLPACERAAIQHALRILCEKVQSLPAETDSSQLPQSSLNLRRRR